MAEIKSFPNNQDEYIGAEYVMRWLHGRTSGVFGAENNASVTAVQGEMQVSVSDGIGWLSNSKGDGVVWWNDAEQINGEQLQIQIDVADGVLNRIDRVVVSWETTNYVARPTVSILKGTASSNAVPPALTNNSVMRQISLARISIPAGTISLTPDLITDERLDPSVCGIVTENVSIDTTVMQNQFEALLTAIQNELTGIIGGTGFDLAPIRVENKSIFSSLFSRMTPSNVEEEKLFSIGYEYKAAVPVDGVISTMIPYVTLSLGDVDSSGVDIANQFAAYNGGIYVYSDGIPDADILALTIEARKAVI